MAKSLNKTQKILSLLKKGKTPQQIAAMKALDVSVNYVYSIRWQAANKKDSKKAVRKARKSNGASAAPEAREPFTPVAGLNPTALDSSIDYLEGVLVDLKDARDHLRSLEKLAEAVATPDINVIGESNLDGPLDSEAD